LDDKNQFPTDLDQLKILEKMSKNFKGTFFHFF
jgi:hypothetical protein